MNIPQMYTITLHPDWQFPARLVTGHIKIKNYTNAVFLLRKSNTYFLLSKRNQGFYVGFFS